MTVLPDAAKDYYVWNDDTGVLLAGQYNGAGREHKKNDTVRKGSVIAVSMFEAGTKTARWRRIIVESFHVDRIGD
ncbi:MAG: hypothetical protein GQ559_08940 [Desulfobulbaceae bacterium]|nr:hypothetical protein [Desulfobulbaceae bacterium]